MQKSSFEIINSYGTQHGVMYGIGYRTNDLHDFADKQKTLF